jgi:aryl-alcohol dehydrogenase-like predicted oxidoreductase
MYHVSEAAAGSLEENIAFLDHAHATGQRFWDTANIFGDSEDIIGGWIARSGKRGDILPATKFGIQMENGFKIRSDPSMLRPLVRRA